MWKRSFVATTVALGGTVDDALSAMTGTAHAGAFVHPMFESGDVGGDTADLVARLRARLRAARAATLARAVRDIVVAIDEGTLR